MKYRKTFNILVALFLLLAVFANSSMAGACFCGQACVHVLQPKAKAKAKILFHMLCPGSLCKSCDLENGQTLKAANASIHKLDMKIHHNTFILSNIHNYSPAYQIVKEFESICTCRLISSSPIYLQNLSILC